MDKELFDFWQKGMEKLGSLLIMEDSATIIKGQQQGVRKSRLGTQDLAGQFSRSQPNQECMGAIEERNTKQDLKLMRKEMLIEAAKEKWEKCNIAMIKG